MIFSNAHSWLERRIERLLFRRRYIMEESLRTLGDRLYSFSDEEELLQEVATSLHATLGLAGCAIYRDSGESLFLVSTAGNTAFEKEMPETKSSLPIGIGRKSYGSIVLAEDPQAEAFAVEEMVLLRTLATQLSATIAVLRAEKYELLSKGA